MSINLIAPVESIVARSADPKRIYLGTPSLCALPDGRLIAAHDYFGPGSATQIHGESCYDLIMGCPVSTDVYVSDDGGRAWRRTGSSPCCHATVFCAGGRVYIMGNGDGRLIIKASDDRGESWGETVCLDDAEQWRCREPLPDGFAWNKPRMDGRAFWRGGATNTFEENGFVYFAYELRKPTWRPAGSSGHWGIAGNSPMLLRGRADSDLTRRENWAFTDPRFFCDDVDPESMRWAGLPLYPEKRFESLSMAPGRSVSPMGPLEFNAVRITDPNHLWYDPEGRTIHLIGRFGCLRTNLAAVYQVHENEDGTLTTSFVRTPAGREWFLLPLPGGQMKFHIAPDRETGTYWLVSSQCTDSMRRLETMPATRFNMPYDQRTRLQLHFSWNCVDWCFAGMIDIGGTDVESRHYCSACISGDDLLVLSRSGSPAAASAHNVDMMTFHRIRRFRDLIY